MTLNGAIMELVMLSEHPIMPVIFKPSIQKIIETVSECEEPQERKGKWISADAMFGGVPFYCSECGENTLDTVMGKPRWNFCPNCGARMEVDNEVCGDT